MSWLNLNQSLTSLKGQITNFASEVLSESAVPDTSGSSSNADLPVKDLEEKCKKQELEIAALKKLNEELLATLQSEKLSRKNGVREDEVNWYWDPAPQSAKELHHGDAEDHIRIPQAESSLKQRNTINPHEDELQRLREENKNLTTNLEDLDHQHQLAMERLLALKKELQKNFEVLKQEHEELKGSNDEYATERQMLLNKIGERDKEIKKLKEDKVDFDTLHHKYLNLEKVHSVQRENLEKFQEENQDLHEEVFKLQEQVTKFEDELEMATKQSELSNSVPREAYDEIVKELHDLKDRINVNRVHLDEINIDDNAKSVIESLKREIHELKHKLVQKEHSENSEYGFVKADKIMQFYNKYVNFDLPVDYVGEMPSSDNDVVLFKVETVFKSIGAFKKDIDALEYQLSEKNHNINHLQSQIDDLTAENDFLTSDIQHFESELRDMKKNNDFLIAEIAALKNSSKLEPIIESHEDNLAKLETELDNCNKINKTFESEIKKIENELNEVRKEKTILHESLNDMRHKYTIMLDEMEMFKTQTKAVKELENSTQSDHIDRLQKAQFEIDDLKKRLNASNTKNEQLSIDLHIIENDKVLLTKELDDLKHKLSETVSAHKELENLQTTLNHKFEDVKVKLDEVIKHKVNLEEDKRKLQEKLSLNEEKEKANTSLQVDLEKLHTEKSQLLVKMDEVLKENATLTETLNRLNMEVTTLKNTEKELKTQNDNLKNNTNSECENVTALQDTIKELKAKIIQQETLNDELAALDQEKHILLEKHSRVEAELMVTDAKIVSLEQEFERLLLDLNEKDVIIDQMRTTIAENNSKLTELNLTINDLNQTVEIKNKEIQRLTISLNETTEKLNSTVMNTSHNLDELQKIENEKNDLNKQILDHHDEVASLHTVISNLTFEKDELKNASVCKDKEIKELNQSIVELTDKLKTLDTCTHQNDEKEAMQRDIIYLKEYLATKELECQAIKKKMEELEKSCLAYKSSLDVATKEKGELINLVNLKHNESIQYHNEIQRLNHILLNQTNQLQKTADENEIKAQERSDICTNCDNLKITLKEKDEIIKSLNQNATELDKMRLDLKHANDSVKELTDKCENLEKNLSLQLDIVKKLTAENVQLSELEQNSTRELERLRHHLMEMEENYTQELMTSEQKLTECQTRLHQVEERAKQNSTVYTSNSIRANQEVETLRNQIKLLEKQREDVQSKLSEAEDARSRSEAALTNLQVVLEQFQLDKEREVHAATEKIRNQITDIKKQNLALKDEIARLNTKLEEASAGLQAATRLGDQVETKTAQINDLKEQVRTLQVSVAAAEERYHNATSNQQDKVDKNLVKNLVLNYVLTTAQNSSNKIQVLRILSTVLDFNQQECERLGLVRSSTTPDSLAAEFVKFLENESKPRTPLPNMMGIAQGPGASRSSTPVSRKNSTLGPQPNLDSGHKRNPSTGSNNLLFRDIDAIETSSQVSIESENARRGALDTGVTQPRDTEGAILKHVLRDM